jgi:PKD repeat protein
LTDNDALPANGCNTGDTYCITDAQIQTELNSFLTAHSLPRGLTNEYFLLTPPAVASCFDAAGTQCSGNASTGAAFCAYHSQSATSTPFLYANIVYTSASADPSFPNGVDGCDPFDPNTQPSINPCAGFLNGCNYTVSWADGTLTAVSHEHNESTTDPQPNNAWTDYQTCAQGAPLTCGGEIGDKCNGDEITDPASQFPLVGGVPEAYNMVINTRHYWLQQEWSNQGHGCLNHLTSLETAPGASFTATADNSSANAVDFNAGGSGAGVAQYVWQFNDDVKPGDTPQQTTVETSSPTFTHTFPEAGAYSVALTTMTPDGRSKGTVTQAVSAGLTQAAFIVSPASPVDTSPVTMDASSTSHDPSVGISSYSWNFGDGSTGSGVTASHRFGFGTHTVTLSVTDTLGRTSPVSHPVSVADVAPTAAFTAPDNGHAGSLLQFRGSAADDEAITAYRWSFGDGGSANGASVPHTFRRPGTYIVTLTVTDIDGTSGSVPHAVKIGPPRCVVPRLQGQTLRAASAALGAAQCKVGRVSKPRH